MTNKEFKEKCLGIEFKTLCPSKEKYGHDGLEPMRLRNRGKYYCSKCGSLLDYKFRCHIHGKTVEERRHQKMYAYNVFEKHGDIQVVRTFYIHVHRKSKFPETYCMYEVYRNFFDGYGHRLIIGKRRRPMTFDDFCVDSEFTVKRNYAQSYHSFTYDHEGYVTYKKSRDITDRFKQLGLRMMNGCSIIQEMILLPKNNLFETALKIGYASPFMRYGEFMFPPSRAKQLFIAHKNGYKIENGQLWLDTIKMAEELGYDIKNSKYVCYTDLRKSHDKFNYKLELIKEKNEMEKHRDYDQRMLKYANVVIKSDDITIRPLMTIDEVLEEGTTMHHCVYSAKYYNVKTSLLLSAKNGKGERLETIELGLRHKKVLQSRGLMNKTTPYHEKIINMVESYKF